MQHMYSLSGPPIPSNCIASFTTIKHKPSSVGCLQKARQLHAVEQCWFTSLFILLCLAHVVCRHLGVAETRQPGLGEVPAAGKAGPRPTGSIPRAVAGTSAAGSAGRCGSWQQLQDAESELLEPHWDAGVYSRVFLSEAAAQGWYAWNSLRGDPAQPFHYQHLLVRLQQQVSREAGMIGLARRCVPLVVLRQF
jgi:hypothetical protein